ncbi:response regulator [uncultured Desulfosarcina sp.]|uniref:response regulator n=1 Tax=uncultured Desulfosarcina sp. TaxID=218289 RepID=UPI0029C85EE9|nr:response regulator [uncultured Desulfosarcina sp.]
MDRKIGSALVAGAGISGIRASIDLAQMGYRVTLTDRAPHMGGILSQLDYQFPSDRCGMCRMLPMVDRDAGIQTCLRKGLFHENIDILLGTSLVSVTGDPGKFEVTLNQPFNPIDPDRCTGCGRCSDVCPVTVPDAFNAGLTPRKAVYLPVPHNIPNTYTIDPAACTRCGACEPICPTGAIRLSAVGRQAFRILVVDDESIIRQSLDAWLGDEEGYRVEMAESGPDALEKLAAAPFHLMLLDIKMPGMDGVEVLEKAKLVQPALQVLMMTAYATVETAVDAMKIGAMDYLIKPFEPEALIPKVAAVYAAFQETGYHKQTVGAIVLATGTTCFDPSVGKNPMGYGIVPNVVTSLEFERMLSGTGPDRGQLLRPSDKRPVKRAAWIQCVGSRDLQSGADFCSTICCMFALKEASVARAIAGDDFQATIIYMDMRTFGKSFERYGQHTESAQGVRLERGRVHSISPASGSDDVAIRWTAASGEIHEASFDLVVLSIGQRPNARTASMAEALDVETDGFGFVKTVPFSDTRTRRAGIFAGGTLTGPTDIAESVIRASSAAVNASRTIHRTGGGLAEKSAVTDAYRDVSREPPCILAVLCHCATAPESDSDLQTVSARLKQDPSVARVVILDSICTADGWQALTEIDTTGINRLLVGACRTIAYGKKVRGLATSFALDPALIESVVMDDGQGAASPATVTAIMAGISRLKQASLGSVDGLTVVNRALVVGGGIAGMSAALAIADHGVAVTLVEASKKLGGNLVWLDRTIDGAPIAPFLEEAIGQVEKHPKIEVMTDSRVVGAFGQAGHFFSTIETTEKPTTTVEHGAVILATGGSEASTEAYGYGTSDAVVTQSELETRLHENRLDTDAMTAVAMIQCVGSREEPRNYCSRVCCPTALKQALWLKTRKPDLQIYILYRDMMTCGLSEAWYTEARRQGILFFQYRPDRKPEVRITANETAPVSVRLHDPILDAPVEIAADLLVLATGIQPRLPETLALAYGAERDRDGFFLEADSKWRPVEALKAGVFGCGIVLSPRSIPEAVATAEAAAGRALAILTADRLPAARTTAIVRHSLCTLCLRCIETCPYDARFLDETGQRVLVNPAMCQGCGDCATVCPNSAAIVEGFTHRSLFGAIEGAFATM